MDHINTIWSAAGHPVMPGHAFRIGRAMELLLEGVHPDNVATQGHWKSRAFLDYWRQIESVLPLFVATAASAPIALMHLQSNMHEYRHLRSVPS